MLHHLRPFAFALALLAGGALPALAVPVGTSADTRAAAPQHRPSWTDGGLDLKVDGSWLSGNVNLSNLSTNLDANYNTGPHQFFLDAGNLYTAAPGNVLVDRIAGSALYAYAVRDNFNAYGYVTAAHDASIKLDSRYTVGLGGCRHKLLPGAFSLLLISVNPAYELDRYQGGATMASWRGVLRATGTKPLTEQCETGFDAFYTPTLTDFADMRVYGEAYLKLKLVGDLLALRLTAADEYDTRPQPGIQNNDVGVFSSLEMAWGR
jgi:hypothetical protein